MWRGITEIPITNGSGDIILSVADETIIEANKVQNEGGEWFKKQYEKLRQGLRNTVEEPRKSRGLKL